MPSSDHFDGQRFFNPTGANAQALRNVLRLLRTPRTAWPASVPVTPQRPPAVGPDQVAVTFIGHSSFLIQSGPANILIDPVYAERASPVSFAGPRRVRAPGVRFDDLPPISTVLVSHNHYDHCDLHALAEIERRWHPAFVTPLANAKLLGSVGIKRVTELDWWERSEDTPVPVTMTPAQHFSARGPFDRNRALWGGFLITLGNRRILFAGDTGYGPHLREIGERLGPFDLALIPIGAYEPRWFMRNIHMDPAEAVEAHLELRARKSIAMHWGTFQLTPEGIDEPVRALAAALAARAVSPEQFQCPEVGITLWLSE